MLRISRDVIAIETLISNAYLVGDPGSWILVDALAPGHERTIRNAAAACFGPKAKPRAIVLTHGHFDHAGSAAELADFWNVKIYAHRLERPYLTGRSSYPPLDPTAPGFFSGLSRFFPSHTMNVGCRFLELEAERPLPWLDGWECRSTPGHSPGHVSFFRPSDRTLLAGDALTTMNLDSFLDTVTKRPRLCRPPVPGTIDWPEAAKSVRALASLEPVVIAAGHGRPMLGAQDALRHLADHFPTPSHGRYANEPAFTSERGVERLPPAPFDAFKLAVSGMLVAAGVTLVLKQRSRS